MRAVRGLRCSLLLGPCGVEIINVGYVIRTTRHFYNLQGTVPGPCRPSGLLGCASVPAYLEIVRLRVPGDAILEFRAWSKSSLNQAGSLNSAETVRHCREEIGLTRLERMLTVRRGEGSLISDHGRSSQEPRLMEHL
jgi:hypothetical protein